MAAKTKKVYVVVHHNNRHVRKEANVNAESMGRVQIGDKLEYLGEIENGWYKVKLGRKIGWLSIGSAKIKE